MELITRGAVITEPGNSEENKTGSWRVFKPVINYEKCIRCMICWQFCPEPSILKIEEKQKKNETPAPKEALKKLPVPVIDYDYCKGCGICFNECPVKAIDFVMEER